MTDSYCFKSPIGLLKLREKDGGIAELSLWREEAEPALLAGDIPRSELLYEAYRQLNEYFAGKRKQFDLPLACGGTPFQRRVWAELQRIPYGEVRSYQDIAAGIGQPKAARAVGQANNRNLVMIIVPCHRVIQKDGKLGGFGCGVEAKEYLLELEKRYRD